MPVKTKNPMQQLLSVFLIAAALTLTGGCSVAPKKLLIKDNAMAYEQGVIIDSASGETISFDALVDVLFASQVIYVGESHTNPAHHEIQLKVIKALAEKNKALVIGMEMFDYTYQDILDQWSEGKLEKDAFLQKTHWYANWRFNYTLYSDILAWAKDNRIRVAGLNIPFHIPPKISTGGFDNLRASEKALLPEDIDLTHEDHKTYVEDIFKSHHIRGRKNFDHFYQAQCTWEDTMAASIAENLENKKMVVVVGNGHIIHKFGIPDRAFKRTNAPFKTLYLAAAGEEAELSYGDYIWVTAPTPSMAERMKMLKRKKAAQKKD